MKFTIDRRTFQAELQAATEIAGGRGISVLANVLLTVDTMLKLQATDLKLTYSGVCPISPEDFGTVTAPADKLLEIMRNLPDGDIMVYLDDGMLHIKPVGRKSSFKLKTISADSYPELSEPAGVRFAVLQEVLSVAIAHTAFAACDDESRYFMSGVYFDRYCDRLRLVATDGRRLSMYTTDAEVPEFSPVIVPTRVLKVIGKQCATGDAMVTVSPRGISFELNGRTYTSTVIEGQFPNYQRVIPEQQRYSVDVDREEFRAAIRRVSTMVESKSRRVYLEIEPDRMTVSSDDGEIGIAREEISVSTTSPSVKIALNYQYVSDPLAVISDESIALEFSEPERAISMRNGPWLHVVMPMQV